MKKKTLKGFTLIELIVVIAIIGILAAILVPNMIGYVKSSKYSTANSNAKLVFTTAAGYCTAYDTNNADKDKPATTEGVIKGNYTEGTPVKNLDTAMEKGLGASATKAAWCVEIDATNLVPKSAGYCAAGKPASGSKAIIGAYPDANDSDSPKDKWPVDYDTYKAASAT